MTPRTLTELPADVAGIVKRLRSKLWADNWAQDEREAASLIESLARQVAEVQSAKLDVILDREKVCKDRDEARQQLAAKDEGIRNLRLHLSDKNQFIEAIGAGRAKLEAERDELRARAEKSGATIVNLGIVLDAYRAAYPKEPT